MSDPTPEAPEDLAARQLKLALILRARAATSTLRDAAREGRVLDHFTRDPLVVTIHNALDLAERACLAGSTQLSETKEDTATRVDVE